VLPEGKSAELDPNPKLLLLRQFIEDVSEQFSDEGRHGKLTALVCHSLVR
jgi:hypothetical protein